MIDNNSSSNNNIKTDIENLKRIEKELETILNQGGIDSNTQHKIRRDLNNVKLKRIEKEMKAFGATIPATAATAAEIGQE
jgi:arginine repressor